MQPDCRNLIYSGAVYTRYTVKSCANVIRLTTHHSPLNFNQNSGCINIYNSNNNTEYEYEYDYDYEDEDEDEDEDIGCIVSHCKSGFKDQLSHESNDVHNNHAYL